MKTDRLSVWQKEIKKYYGKYARQIMTEWVEIYSKEMQVNFSKIRIGDQTSRWGRCSSNKTLSFNLRLVLAPEYVAEYVAVHEVAHLIEQNHSRKFWKIVENHFPDQAIARRWLKKNGKELWKYF